MMRPIQSIAERIVELSSATTDKEVLVYDVKNILIWLVDDVLKAVRNINETSLPGSDRTNRIIEMEQKFGIPKTHIL